MTARIGPQSTASGPLPTARGLRYRVRAVRYQLHDRVSRVRDVALAAALLLPAAPIMAVVALAVRRRMGTPVLFRQTRAGRFGQPFVIYKFRTMLDETAPDGSQRSEAERLTPLGELLRSWSLDELPQLINVLRGDMALVGPRPLYPSYLPLYSAEQARRHLVRPGLTGMAQVFGRNSLSWEEKFALDVRYVDERSLWLDLRLLLLTAHRVLQRSGVRTEGFATSPMFTGSPVVALPERGSDAVGRPGRELAG
jgi:lipopolysaccharide/colanic/teichoic acid biosynthesis glycosyltransferase